MNIFYGKEDSKEFQAVLKDKVENIKKEQTNMKRNTPSNLEVPPYRTFVKG